MSIFTKQLQAALNRILTGVFQFFQVTAAARILGPVMFGEYSVAWGITGLCLGVASGFIWTPLIRFAAGSKKDLGHQLSSYALKAGFIGYIGISLFILVFGKLLSEALQNPALLPFTLLLPIILLSRLYYDLSRAIFFSNSNLGVLLLIDTIFNGSLLLLFLCFKFFIDHVTVRNFLSCHIIAGALASLCGLINNRDIFFKTKSKSLPPEIYKFSITSGMNSFVLYFYSQADIFMAGLTMSPVAVGIYSGARSLTRIINMTIEAINTMSLATASTLVNQGSKKNLAAYIRKLISAGWLVTIPIALILFFGSTAIITFIFGGSYAKSAGVTAILSIGCVFLAVSSPTASALDAIGKPWIPLIAKIVGLCVFFLTCFLTVTWLGERGLALASLFGIVSIALFQVVKLFREI
jgi:O-antigen/teichoic acid export membrane protein